MTLLRPNPWLYGPDGLEDAVPIREESLVLTKNQVRFSPGASITIRGSQGNTARLKLIGFLPGLKTEILIAKNKDGYVAFELIGKEEGIISLSHISAVTVEKEDIQ